MYKKKSDRLFEIEDFLGGGAVGLQIKNNRRLTDLERDSLKGRVTLNELEKSLEKSNMNSSCGWDRVSYFVIKNIGV